MDCGWDMRLSCVKANKKGEILFYSSACKCIGATWKGDGKVE